MEIQELFLEHYGKFENHRIRLRSGVNIIYGGNEAGKSTIHSFIRAMLFGMQPGREKAKDEYALRRPWGDPAQFSGSMLVREGRKLWRIERNFDSRGAGLRVYEVTGQGDLPEPGERLSEIVGGISEASFVNTVYIPQLHVQTGEALAKELRRCMVNAGGGSERQVDVEAALGSLRRKKAQAEQKKQKEEAALEAQIEKRQTEGDYLRRELRMLEQQLQGAKGPDEETEDEETGTLFGKRALEVLLALAGVLALAGAAFLQDLVFRIVLGVLGAVFMGLLYPVHRMQGDLIGEPEEMPERADRDAYLEGEIRRRRERYRKLQTELEGLYREQVRTGAADTEIAALALAIDRICELTVGLFGPDGCGLNQRASEILREITKGRYERIVMDDTGSIRIHTPDRVLELCQVGSGTIQQIYFAVRLAAGELFGGGVKLPLILDEAFALYDDERLEAALRWLHRDGRQVLVFTCQKREREIMNRIRVNERERSRVC